MVPGRDVGPVITRRGEGAHRALHHRGGAGGREGPGGRPRQRRRTGREGGYYVGPTLIDHVAPDMRIAQEEVFGPVMVIIRARDVDEALAVRERVAVRQRRVDLHRERRRGAPT